MKRVSYPGPMNLCTCGHTGDVQMEHGESVVSEHHGLVGHGPCRVCPAGRWPKFTWAGHTQDFKAEVARVQKKTRRKAR